VTLRSLGPSRASGTVVAPPSKSYTHRALVIAYLSGGACTVEGPLASQDTYATRSAIASLGRRVRASPGRWTVAPSSPSRAGRRPLRIDCGRSGTTLRFLSVLAATQEREVLLEGAYELALRPIEPLLTVLEAAGARVRRPGGGRSVPLSIRGPIHSLACRLDASESSQFLSALLLVLPTLGGESRLTMRGPVVSQPYVRATLDAMARSGVRADFDGREARIPGGQEYRPGRLSVPGDASSASYMWAAGAVSGGPVRVEGVPSDRPQADLVILDILESMGAQVARGQNAASAQGGQLVGTEVELTDSPDLYPLVGVLAAMASGVSRLGGAPHVVRKESDRRRATISLARGMGASVRADQDALLIRGNPHPTPLDLRGCDDHRVVMSAAVAALTGSGRSTLGEAESVRKSYPGFWRDLRSIGARSRGVQA